MKVKGFLVLVAALGLSLSISSTALALPTIFNGDTLYGSISSAYEHDPYYFLGNSGDLTDIFLFRTDNTGNNWGTLDPVVELWYGATYLTGDDDSGGDSPVPGPYSNSLINDFSLPYSGEYTILARGYSSSTGTYGLSLNGSGRDTVVPEPASLSLLGLGLLGLLRFRKNRSL